MTRVPHSVVSGFSCGIGAMMLISQLDIILGVASPLTRSSSVPLWQLIAVGSRLGDTRLMPLLLGLTVVLAAFLVTWRSHRLPAPLIGVALAIVVGRLFHMHEREVGLIPAGLPPLAANWWDPRELLAAIPSAFALAVISSVNILITSRVVEHFRGRHRRMRPSDADKELGAYGLANICGGLFGAPLSVGIPARSLAVVRCGGTTSVSNFFHAVFLLAILWLGSGFVAHIPIPALAGVTAWMGLCLLDWSAWRRLGKMTKVDAAAFLVTAAGVLTLNPVLAVAIGCLLYGMHALYVRSARPQQMPGLQQAP
jgi:SulP family sulfate permease